MSLSEMVVKVIGIALAVVGFALLLAVVGLSLFGIGFSPIWAEVLLGAAFLGVGIYIIRGGTFTL